MAHKWFESVEIARRRESVLDPHALATRHL